MRTLTLTLLTLIALPAFAKWEPCPTTCTPPATISGLSRLPLYAGPVKFSTASSGAWWSWLKTVATPCSAAQLANASDKVACNVPIGSEMFRTPRFKQSAGTLSNAERVDVPIAEQAAQARVYAPPWCPLRLPDSAYTADQGNACRWLEMELSEQAAN